MAVYEVDTYLLAWHTTTHELHIRLNLKPPVDPADPLSDPVDVRPQAENAVFVADMLRHEPFVYWNSDTEELQTQRTPHPHP